MKRTIRYAFLALALSATTAFAANPMVGGKEMYPTKNIVENAANSADHTTLVAAVKAAGLVPTLEGKGPFTVFAPTNAAFEALPAGTVETLLKPENKAKLTAVLTYHVVAGDITAEKLAKKIKAGGGKAELKTVNGEKITAMMSGDKVAHQGRQGRRGDGDHRRRQAVQRRDPRHRQSVAALIRVGRCAVGKPLFPPRALFEEGGRGPIHLLDRTRGRPIAFAVYNLTKFALRCRARTGMSLSFFSFGRKTCSGALRSVAFRR